MNRSDAPVKENDALRVKPASDESHGNDCLKLNAKHCLIIFLRCFLFSALIFLAITTLLPPTFDGVDDAHIMMIASGVGPCQQPDPHIVFGQVYWGRALVWLYSQNGDVPWYGLSLALAHIFSLALILSVFAWERASAVKRSMLVALFVLYLLTLWTSLQFTTASLMLAEAASLVVLSTLEVATLSRSGKAMALALATLALVAATSIRFMSALMMFAMFAGLICCRFAPANLRFKNGLNKSRITKSKLGAGLLTVLVMLGILIGLEAGNQAFYKLDPRWSAFEGMRATMVAICDYQRIPPREKAKKILHALNWNKSDLELFENYYYPIDPTLFSVKNARTLVNQSQGWRSVSPAMVLHEVQVNLLSIYVLPGLILACALLPLANKKLVGSLRQIAYVVLLAGLLAFLLLFLKLVMRITMPVGAWALLLAIYYCDESKLTSTSSIISCYLPYIPFAERIPRQRLYAQGKKLIALALSPLVVLGVNLIIINADISGDAARLRPEFKSSLAAIRNKVTATLYIAPSIIPFELISPYENPRAYFGDMAILIPYFAPSPLREIKPRVIKDTLLPLLDDGVYVFSSKYLNKRLKKYYWVHHRLRVSFQPYHINEKLNVRVFKAKVMVDAPGSANRITEKPGR